ncbi:MAG: PEP/pyruvate-binding domain-containing protein, partial [Halobacteriota archaeon]|nr:PEP/pyruvate-binding domain-containing protein [Halobacteriota archaeon]
MSDDMSIVWLEDVNAKDITLVGGKGASLGEMINASLPVPGGFAVTATAFRRFLDETGIADKLFKILDVNVDNDKELKKAEKLAKDLILTTEIPEYMNNDIIEAYKELCKREGKNVFVAVRSSATAEDLPDASFAGQQETFLNIKGEADLLEAVKKCWASLYGARAIFYRSKQGFDHDSVNISVIVQIMINAEKAGVMFTSHPSTGAAEAVIEAAWGLGESVVSGSVSPDNYVVETKTMKIKSKMIAKKEVMHITNSKGSVLNEDVPDDMKESQVMTNEEIIKLAKMGKIIEEHYGSPQDVEWTLNDGNLNIVQSRPITTISEAPKEGATEVSSKEIIL